MLIKLDAVEEKTKGGIYIPDELRDRQGLAQASGCLIAKGPLAFIYDVDNPIIPEIGERVAFPKYSGLEQKGRDGVDYRLLKDGDLQAILAE